MTEEDAETLRLIKLRHYQPMPHGVTEALCWKASQLIERQNNAINQMIDCQHLTSRAGGFIKEKIMNAPQIEMPRYKSHKEVHALRIASLADGGDGSGIITPAENGYAPFRVDQIYMKKHQPKAGGYYVVYADGYTSFSPAQAFEEGYIRIA